MLIRFKNSSWLLVFAVMVSLLVHGVAFVSMNVYWPEQESPPLPLKARLLASVVPPAAKEEALPVEPAHPETPETDSVKSKPKPPKPAQKKPPIHSNATQAALPDSSKPPLTPDPSSDLASQPQASTNQSIPAGQSEVLQNSGVDSGSGERMLEAGTSMEVPDGGNVPVVPDNWAMNGCVKYSLTVRYGVLGGELGQAEQCWSRDDQAYIVTLQGKASAAWKSYEISQRAVGALVGGAPAPRTFSEQSDGKKYETQFFANKIEQDRNGNTRQVPTEGAALDMLSLMHFLSMLPEDIGAFDIFVVVNRGNVDRVTVLQYPVRQEVFPTGTVEARKFHVEARSGELKIDVWVAKGVYNMPLRFRIDNKGDVFDFQSIEITVGGNTIAHRPTPPMRSGDD